MGAVRANWHLGDLDLPQAGSPRFTMGQLQSSANVIDLSRSEAELAEEFNDLLDKEGRYSRLSTDEQGKPLECELKWQSTHKLCGGSEGTCYRCPSYVDHRERPLGLLCRLGRQQEDILDLIAAAKSSASLDAEMALAFQDDIEAAAELAEAFA